MLKAIVSALKSCWRVLKSATAFLFRVLGAIGGGSAMPEVEEPEVETVDVDDAAALAGRIMTWAVGCVRTRNMEPAPASLPPFVREWMQALDLREATLMVDAGRMGIHAHIAGGALEGVPPADMLPSVMPSWRQANKALRDAKLVCSKRWQKMCELAAPAPVPAASSAEPKETPGYVPTFA